MTDSQRILLLQSTLRALIEAVEDAMETEAEAASWARAGDMRGYIADARDALVRSGYRNAPGTR